MTESLPEEAIFDALSATALWWVSKFFFYPLCFVAKPSQKDFSKKCILFTIFVVSLTWYQFLCIFSYDKANNSLMQQRALFAKWKCLIFSFLENWSWPVWKTYDWSPRSFWIPYIMSEMLITKTSLNRTIKCNYQYLQLKTNKVKLLQMYVRKVLNVSSSVYLTGWSER